MHVLIVHIYHERQTMQPEPPTIRPAADALYERVRAAAGTDIAKTLADFAKENQRGLSANALRGDPVFAEQVEAILNGAAAA